MSHAAYTAYCRCFQAIMKIANYALPYREPIIIEGEDSMPKLADTMVQNCSTHPLVVVGKTTTKLRLPDKMFKEFEKHNIEYKIFNEFSPNPTSDDVEAGFSAYISCNCDSIVAFGGGSQMDGAKAIAALVAHPKKSVSKLQGVLKVHKKIVPLYAIPTTAGTGSETTVAAVITNSQTHQKKSINDPSIIPAYAVLDPTLTLNLSAHLTATCGMDALCHAVEAFTNKTYNTHLEDELAVKAVKLIHDNLLESYRDGSDIVARQNMLKASFYAGRAFTRGCVGYVHSIGHAIGGIYGIPHGLAMSIILPHVLRAYGSKVYEQLAILAKECSIEGSTDKELALGFISWIESIKEAMNIPKKFEEIQERDIPTITKWAASEANPLYPVPEVWNRAEIEAFIKDKLC